MASMFEVFTPEEIQRYNNQGYSNEQIQEAVNQQTSQPSALQQSYSQVQQTNTSDPRSQASHSFVTSQYNQNLIQWQLELDSLLEGIEHMLRGDKPQYMNGTVIWKAVGDKERLLNDEGVAEVMKVLLMYINKNTLLSNYREETINEKMYDLGRELNDLFYCKYEKIGMDTLEKRKLYPMIIRETTDSIHSAYLRALHGMERESLRKMITLNQSESINGTPQQMPMTPIRERSVLNPMRWLNGKYAI